MSSSFHQLAGMNKFISSLYWKFSSSLYCWRGGEPWEATWELSFSLARQPACLVFKGSKLLHCYGDGEMPDTENLGSSREDWGASLLCSDILAYPLDLAPPPHSDYWVHFECFFQLGVDSLTLSTVPRQIVGGVEGTSLEQVCPAPLHVHTYMTLLYLAMGAFW